MTRTFEIRTISKILDEVKSPTKVRLFNFAEGVFKIDLAKKNSKQILGSSEATWIRIYDNNDQYYDYLTSSIFYSINKYGVSIMCSEETEYVDIKYVVRIVKEYLSKNDSLNTPNKIRNNLEIYYKQVNKELSKANKKLMELYSASKQLESERVDIQDSYEYGKAKLIKKYLLDTIAKKIIKENKEAVIQQLM